MAHVSECDTSALADFGIGGDAHPSDHSHDDASRAACECAGDEPDAEERGACREYASLVTCPARD